MGYNRDSDEALSKPLFVYGTQKQTIDQFCAQLEDAVMHSRSLQLEGVRIEISNKLALELIEKLQSYNIEQS
jgi:hypothetical protein